MERAYCTLEIKSVDADQRVIEGIASTPELDRQGDILDSAGASFTLPLPLLWQHRQDQPIGQVIEAHVSPSGIRIKAKIASGVLPFIDDAWALIKSGLVRGLSVGWKAMEPPTVIEGGKAYRYAKWHWGELSAVTIPANLSASIQSIKSIDQQHLAASGHPPPGVSGFPVVRARKDAPAMTATEQISAFEAKRAAHTARMNELMEKSAGATFDDTQREEYETLEREVDSIDEHLPRLRKLEQTNKIGAVPVVVTNTKTASEVRDRSVSVKVTPNLPPGTAFARFVIAKIAGKGSTSDAIRFAESNQAWMDQTPEVALALKAVVNPGTIAEPAWAAPLAVAQPMVNEFLGLLRPATLLGKVPNLRQVPFNISVPVQTGGGTYGWVGEGAPKPVGNLQLTSATLGVAKAAGIIVISAELAKVSNPSAEQVVRNDMLAGMAQFLDVQFIDPTVAAVTNVSPASITNLANGYATAGTSSDNARTDLKKAVTLLTQANYNIGETVFIMSEANAFALAGAITTLGVRPFPDVTAKGGSILGIPVVTSQAAGQVVALVHGPSILYADDGAVNIDVSQEATVELNTVPTSPPTASSVLISLWQQNLIGLRAERFINWKRARTTSVVYTTATYV